MPFCPACGIESRQHQDCPLCGTDLQPEAPTDLPPFPVIETPPDELPLSWRKLRLLTFEILTVLLIVTMIAVAVVDCLRNGSLSWSRFTLLALGASWFYQAFCLYLYRKPYTVFGLNLFVTACLLFGIDIYAEGKPWFWSLGFPILAVLGLLGTACAQIFLYTRRTKAKIAGTLLVTIGCFCLVTNALVNQYLGKTEIFSWSLPVSGSVFPVGVFMFYVHYRLAKTIDLGKIFHV